MIEILPPQLVDQIAAGEVIERPASVVKELIENAIDAQATKIEVIVSAAGLGTIAVSDNGRGMSPKDATLAPQRHATSKLSSFSDLDTLQTFGFRGEALPAIASVSRFSLTTRAPKHKDATRIRLVEGDLHSHPAARDNGTTVVVEDLFYNVPARLKFLKAPATESAHISEVCFRAALCNPEVDFRFIRDNRLHRHYPACKNRQERVRQLWPDKTLSEVQFSNAAGSFAALLGPPEQARSGMQALHVLINNRPVKDRGIGRAIAIAYGSLLTPGRYPYGVVFVDIDGDQVDLNVHPQKTEVRFRNPKQVWQVIADGMAKHLGLQGWKRFETASPQVRSPQSPGYDRIPPSPFPTGSHADPAHYLQTPSHEAPQLDPIAQTSAVAVPHSKASATNYPSAQQTISDTRGPYSRLRVIGQTQKLFLVCEGSDGIHIIDQHAADERIKYNHLRNRFLSHQIQTQRLLFPERISLRDEQMLVVEEHQQTLQRMGIEAVIVGKSSVAIHAVPQLLHKVPPAQLLLDALDKLSPAQGRSFDHQVDHALATMACHGAIRAGDALSIEEATALLQQLDGAEHAGHCPHGRPIVHSIRFDEIRRQVGR